MGISAVIPIHNEEWVLEAVLQRVEGQSHKVDEVVLVLDRCSDGSERIARAHDGKIIHADEGNMALAVMAGVAAASHETIVIFDANTLVPTNYVETLSETARMTGADIVEWHGGLMLLPRATLDHFGGLSSLHLWTLEFFLRVRDLGGKVIHLDGPFDRLKPSPLRRNVRYGLDYALLSERHHLAPFFRIGTKSGLLPDLFATIGTIAGHARRGRLGRALRELPAAIRAG